MSREPAPRLPIDPGSEFRNLHANGSASLAELREFLAGLKGRKPQEVIGIVSANLLIQSITISTLATVGILTLFTVGPYVIYGPPQPKQAAKPVAAQNAPVATSAPAAEAQGAVEPAATAKGADTSTNAKPDAAKAAKVMGLDETKAADPGKNPLDTPNFDKLLDGVEK